MRGNLFVSIAIAGSFLLATSCALGVEKASGESGFRDCQNCPEMVVIPSGKFAMGSPNTEGDRFGDEDPIHLVTVQSFALGKYPVTFREWDACVEGGGCKGYLPKDRDWGREDRPVINVSWEDAKAYAEWLSRKTGKQYRLPTEAEWEYAARAGTTTSRYWGEQIGSNNANCFGCGSQWDYKQTAPVGKFSSNAFGLYDMLGNVWEWVEDCSHDNYNGAPTDGSAWESGGDCSQRSARGGSWFYMTWSVRAATRYSYSTSTRSGTLGFRIARNP